MVLPTSHGLYWNLVETLHVLRSAKLLVALSPTLLGVLSKMVHWLIDHDFQRVFVYAQLILIVQATA